LSWRSGRLNIDDRPVASSELTKRSENERPPIVPSTRGLRKPGRAQFPYARPQLSWRYPSPVTATKECPSSSETVCSGTPAASIRVANECLRVCRPTPLMSKAFAAVLIARSAFLGLTAVPLSVVNTRPASTQIEEALSRSAAWLTSTDRSSAKVAGDRARRGVSAPSGAH